MIQAPGAADDGLFARNEAGRAAGSRSLRDRWPSGMTPGVAARLVGDAWLPDGRRAVPVFQLVAERYLDPAYAPEAVADACGIPAATIRRLAAEMAHAAFEEEIELPCRGPTGPGGATKRCAAGRCHCMRCAASPRIRTASRPAALCICCRCCSARSMCPAAGATRRRTRSRVRPGRSPPASRSRLPPASRCPAFRSATRCRPKI